MDREPVKRAMDGDRLEKASDRSTWRNILNVMKQARERMGQSAEKFKNALASFKDIAAVSGVTRKRMRALALAGGAAFSFEQLEKKDLMATMIPGTFTTIDDPASFEADYVIGIDNDVVYLNVVKAIDNLQQPMHWVWIENNGGSFMVDWGWNSGSTATNPQLLSPDAVNDMNVSNYLAVTGDANQGQKYRYVVDTDEYWPGGPKRDETASINEFLNGSTVHIGLNAYTSSNPQPTLQELIDNTAIVVSGQIPSNLNTTDGVVLYADHPVTQLQGDFNNDGTVDAADYVVWRKTGEPANGFETWRGNYGNTTGGAGAGSSVQALPENNGGVPEASTLALAGLGTGVYLLTRRTREAGTTLLAARDAAFAQPQTVSRVNANLFANVSDDRKAESEQESSSLRSGRSAKNHEAIDVAIEQTAVGQGLKKRKQKR